MPPYTTLRNFIDALNSGQTNITRCLDTLANDGAQKAAHSTDMARPGLLNGTRFPEWLRTALTQAGMTAEELDHIEHWPDSQKELARAQVSQAWTEGRPIYFGWELYDGDQPVNEVRRDANQDVRLVFRSPRKGVHLDSLVRVGEVKVDA